MNERPPTGKELFTRPVVHPMLYVICLLVISVILTFWFSVILTFYLVGTGAFVCCLVHRGSTNYLLLLQIFSGVV